MTTPPPLTLSPAGLAANCVLGHVARWARAALGLGGADKRAVRGVWVAANTALARYRVLAARRPQP